MKKPVSDVLLLMLGLTVLLAIALDGRRTRKSAGKQPSYSSYESNKPQLKRSLICGRIDSLDDKTLQPKPARRFHTARAKDLRDGTDRLAIETKAAQRLIDYADENQRGNDLKDADDYSKDANEQIEDSTNDSQDDAGEPEDTADEPEDTSDDSEDDDDDSVE